MDSPRRDRTVETRERILEGARVLFLRHGLRATSMEAIARQAGVAKPTLYAHFPEKDAVFVTILEALLAGKIQAFEAGLRSEGPLAERVGNALASEFAVIAKALEGSPHAEELFGEHRRAAQLFRQSEEAVLAKLAAALGEGGLAEPERLAHLLLDASFGLAQKAIGRHDLGADIRLLAERLLA